ncbi:MAG TPA: phosphopantetheine-binding protein [Labilithrix sp.]|jgi:bifunctional isochorismate lyase/aryl carrier protein|nr:phosphopantetheine-binding protein [Labilithrix sp.]
MNEIHSAPVAALPSTYEALSAEIAALIEVDASELSPDDSLLDWGLDSLRLMTILERLRASGIEVAFVELAEQPTLRYLAGRLGLEAERT